mgnify:CR=1 FL=1
MRKIRLGMVGGGRGAFIGGVHRIAARLDGRFDLVAGALSSDPTRARDSAADLGITADRAYADFSDMARTEAERAEFWHEQFAKCIRCYACRNACPSCFCPECDAIFSSE